MSRSQGEEPLNGSNADPQEEKSFHVIVLVSLTSLVHHPPGVSLPTIFACKRRDMALPWCSSGSAASASDFLPIFAVSVQGAAYVCSN